MASNQHDKAITLFTLGCVLFAVILVTASSFYFDTNWRPTGIEIGQSEQE